MKALVTGVAGFIGSHLADELLAALQPAFTAPTPMIAPVIAKSRINSLTITAGAMRWKKPRR